MHTRAAEHASRPATGAAILVVDDEQDIRESLVMFLEATVPDHRILSAAGGEEALRLIEGAGDVALILSDYRMPGMDGVEFLAKARQRLPDTPSVMVTAFPDPGLAARARREAGVGLFIAKPFDMDQLIAVVRSMVDAQGTGAAAAAPSP